jgi:hypothetical protein
MIIIPALHFNASQNPSPIISGSYNENITPIHPQLTKMSEMPSEAQDAIGLLSHEATKLGRLSNEAIGLVRA